MLILLPPSETKRDGGAEGIPLDLASLSFPELSAARRSVSVELRKLSSNLTTMAAALKLGVGQQHELQRNRAVRTSPTMPAIDRYTGVLYDALDAQTLPADAREFAAGHVVVHSALFGLVGAGDAVPAYRLSHDSRLPTLSLKKAWREPIAGVLSGYEGLILDLRSEAYVALGPAPVREGSYFLRLVAEGSDGAKRALNHFNKKGKGEFVRSLLLAGIDHPDVDSLLAWAADAGHALSFGNPGELQLEVVNSVAA
ncbi:MAG TPA: peroxide stress protein YaaA [Homoserinimonas sp.]|nr:peroxide stress protein YaaA [Homoserinimonas sp.]